MSDILLINVSGHDKPGLTSAITSILAAYDLVMLDVGQSVIHDHLTWGMLVRLPQAGPSGNDASQVIKDLLFEMHARDLQISFTPVAEADYNEWVKGKGKTRFIVTLLAREIKAEHIARASAITAANGLNIDQIQRLSTRLDLYDASKRNHACIELSVRGEPHDPEKLKTEFLQIANELNIDIAFQKDDLFRRNRRLVVFDMDSTLIEAEVIDELAKEAGVGDQVIEITELAMRGEIEFAESFRRRVRLLKGLKSETLETVALRLKLTEGAELLISSLRKLGYKTAILSGGFNFFARRLQAQLGIDYVFANELDIRDGLVTGEVSGEIVDGARKAALLHEIAAREGIQLEQVIAVGDGANDLPMLSTAGLGVAFRAKPVVRKSASQSISYLGLDSILYLLGFRESDLRLLEGRDSADEI
ncbi:phosphoserine phosphatase SerB [Allohahella sp. A8]|uniref:phosphoserine phosphatase SerB n=1 Tax=Allohahella sp. A8 TaxID=3141461 RepID=UPI000C0931FC|nr:phosphoserine phosphatase SerB [Hahellaceae bacterium]|tara:strand:- start:13350 stop:14606 length:1257 start_codon:yes stop_codon:yes gene_type:complete